MQYESAQSALSAESFESCLDENGLSQEVFQNEGERIVYTPFRHV